MEAHSGPERKVSPFRRLNLYTEYENELLDDDDDTPSVHSLSTEGGNTLRHQYTIRERLLKILHSTRYQVFIVTLIVLDTLIVITELLLDLELSGTESQIPEVFHSISIGLLSIFVIEVLIKLYAYKLEFFTLKGEVFDAAVVIVALILDTISLHSHNAFAGTGLVIVLRLWRVVRIQNSMVMSVHKTGERRLTKEKEIRKAVEVELELMKEKNKQLRQCCRDLLNIMTEHGVEPSPSCNVPDLDN